MNQSTHTFSYNLGVKTLTGAIKSPDITICCHGYGHNNQIVDVIHSYDMVPGTLVGFNFPDYNIKPHNDHRKSVLGSIDEILPLLHLIKHYACDLKNPKINLYGFSAGGGAIVNALAVLTLNLHSERLQEIGITQEHKKQMLQALEQGIIILDCPLKSIDEVIDLRGRSPQFEVLAQRYAHNNMNPINTLRDLKDQLNMHIIIHFQNPDDILGNRDDELFIERLRAANKGTTTALIGFDGGHNSCHAVLWRHYRKIIK